MIVKKNRIVAKDKIFILCVLFKSKQDNGCVKIYVLHVRKKRNYSCHSQKFYL